MMIKDKINTNYKNSPLGLIPNDWEVKKVFEVCDFIVPDRDKPELSADGIPWITTPDLISGSDISFSKSNLFVSKEYAKRNNLKIVPVNSVIMTCVGDLGIVALTKNEIIINQQLHAFIPSKLIDSHFLLNALEIQRKYFEKVATKTAVPYLNKDNCNSTPILLPPLHEQKAIAYILGLMDNAINKNNQLLSQKELCKKWLMQNLLTGKKKLKGFSGEWKEVILKDVAKVTMGQSPNSEDYNNEGIGLPLIQGNADLNERKQVVRFWTSQSNKECESGDIIMTVRAPVGAIGIAIHNSSIGRGVCCIKPTNVNFWYLYHLLVNKEEQWKKLEQGSTFTAVGSKDIFHFPLFITHSTKEQTAIAQVLQAADKEIQLLKTKTQQLRLQKKGLMQVLLTGKKRLLQ